MSDQQDTMYFNMDSNDYAPFFREGLLHFPPRTLDLLAKAGVDQEIVERARRGLVLDDDRKIIGQISNTLVKILEHLATNSEAYKQLNSPETRFMLSDIDKDAG